MTFDSKSIRNYETALDDYNADELKIMLKELLSFLKKNNNIELPLFTGKPSKPEIHKIPTRKQEIIRMISDQLAKDSIIKLLYNSFRSIEQKALSEMVWGECLLNRRMFKAKYGELYDENGKLSLLLNLFRCNGNYIELIPECKPWLKSIVPKPLESQPVYTQESRLGMFDDDIKEENMETFNNEFAALHDARAVMNLAATRGIEVGVTTSKITGKGAAKIKAILKDSDYYPWIDNYPGIKPFAWGMILIAAGMVVLDGKKLRITDKGKRTLKLPDHDIIKILWTSWLKYSGFHELSRVTEIKGQSRRNTLKAPQRTRNGIATALSHLTPGEWIHVNAFESYIYTRNLWVDVGNDYWNLYIVNSRYGSLGYDQNYKVVENRFLLTFLLEYAATMGIIDVALVSPEYTRDDFQDMWGGDCLEYLSIYDGLWYLRLTELGCYALGVTDKYTAPLREEKRYFEVMANRDILLLDDDFKTSDRMFLERIASSTSEMVWRLDKKMILNAISEGTPLHEIREFLIANSAAALPGPVEKILEEIKEKTDAVKITGKGIIIECKDDKTASLMMNDKTIGKLVHLREKNNLIIKEENEKKFKNALLKKGYIIPA